MVQKLKHSSLNFSVSWLIVIESLCTNGINFIDENDGGRFLFGKSKSVSDHFRSITDIHLHKIWAGELKKSSFSLTGTGSGHHSFSSSWGSKHQATFWWSDTNVLEFFFVCDWQDNSFSKFFNLFIKSTNVSILFGWSLFDLHWSDSWVILGWEFFKENVGIFIDTNKLSWPKCGTIYKSWDW